MSQRVSAAELKSRRIPDDLDQCGYCGGWFRPGPDDLDGVCYMHRGVYSDGALWDAGFGEEYE